MPDKIGYYINIYKKLGDIKSQRMRDKRYKSSYHKSICKNSSASFCNPYKNRAEREQNHHYKENLSVPKLQKRGLVYRVYICLFVPKQRGIYKIGRASCRERV